MSKQNKVNPGMYTQRGRLTQDDAARELRKQRQIGSQHTWQPTKKNELPRLESKNRADGTETTEDNASMEETSVDVEASTAPVAKKKTVKKAAKKTAPPKAKAKTAKTNTVTRGNAKKTAAKQKRGKAKKAAATRATAKPKRKAVLARNAGGLRLRSGEPRAAAKGGGANPRPAAKRRKN